MCISINSNWITIVDTMAFNSYLIKGRRSLRNTGRYRCKFGFMQCLLSLLGWKPMFIVGKTPLMDCLGWILMKCFFFSDRQNQENDEDSVHIDFTKGKLLDMHSLTVKMKQSCCSIMWNSPMSRRDILLWFIKMIYVRSVLFLARSFIWNWNIILCIGKNFIYNLHKIMMCTDCN